jgi:hypothetical protein
MPIRMVSQMGMSWRPGSTSRPRAPMMSPTTMALMMRSKRVVSLQVGSNRGCVPTAALSTPRTRGH